MANTSAKEEKRTYWANHIRQWAASGKTQSDYCQHHQLKLHQLVYWKRVLDAKPKAREPVSTGGFVAVQLSQAADVTAQGLTITLANGIRIEGAHLNNLDLIREIIRWQL